MFKLKSFILSSLLVLAFSSTAFASISWWDAKDVKKNSDGSVQYSIQLDNYMNKNNGDVFSGIVVLKYGRNTSYSYSEQSKKIYTLKNAFGSSVVALKGLINGKDITNIQLTRPIDVKYIDHNEKCRNARITANQKKKLTEFDKVRKKNGIEISANCGCPIITQKEEEAILTPENEILWSMLQSLKIDNTLFVSTIKLNEVQQEYWRPNMFNGTYMYNGREFTLDLYQKLTAITTVRFYPLKSVYDNSAIFEIFQSRIGSYRKYKVFKEGSTYKAQETIDYIDSFINPSEYNTVKFIPPTEELVEYAEAISRLLGINITH